MVGTVRVTENELNAFYDACEMIGIKILSKSKTEWDDLFDFKLKVKGLIQVGELSKYLTDEIN
jgi:hypothetical protein